MAFDFLLNVLIVRSAGASGRGAYSLFVTTIIILALFVGAGLQYSNIYIVGRRRSELRNIFSNAIIFNLLIGIILFTMYFAFRSNIDQLLRGRRILQYGLYTFISLPFLLIFLNNVSILLGLQEIRKYNAVQILNSGFRLILIAVAIIALNANKIDSIIFGWVGSILLVSVISSVIVLRHSVKMAFFKLSLFIESLKVGIRAASANIIDFLLIRVDIYLLRFFLPLKFVGYFAIALFFSEGLFYIPNIVGDLLAPKVASDRTGLATDFTKIVSRGSVLVASLGCALLLILGRPLMVFVFGPDFVISYITLLILFPGVIAFSLQKIIIKFYVGKGYPPIMYIASSISLITNIMLGIILIPRYRVVGAAITTSVGYILKTIIMTAYFMKKTSTPLSELIVITKDDLLRFHKKLKGIRH